MTKAEVARFKWPERLVVVPELPATKVGKIEKKALRRHRRAAGLRLKEATEMTSLKDETTAAVFDSPGHQAKLAELYRDFDAEGMTPLWRTREGLLPFSPEPRAVPHLWRWARLYPLAARSAGLVPVGRGGERRAIGLGLTDTSAPDRSRGERLWGSPGLTPVSAAGMPRPASG